MADRIKGTVKFYDPTKGWGFITPDDRSPDVFVHKTELRASRLSELQENDRVEFVPVAGKPGKGPKAVDVELVRA